MYNVFKTGPAAPAESCQSSSLSSCNVTTSMYEMTFTTCQNQLSFIQNVTMNVPSFVAEITVTGWLFINKIQLVFIKFH